MISNENIRKVISLVEHQVQHCNPAYVSQLASRRGDPFQILISTILSSRTKDETTQAAAEKLFTRIQTPRDLDQLSVDEISQLIYPVGFYRIKSQHLKNLAKILLSEYNGSIPDTLEKLLRLPGVGRKTANLVITLAYNQYGICVDTHVHRIVNRWGYVTTKTPIETEFALREQLPKHFWKRINALLIMLGKKICTPLTPKCHECMLSHLCQKVGVKVKKNKLASL
jgi:endonuclease-3